MNTEKIDGKSLERIQRELKIRYGIDSQVMEDQYSRTDIRFEWNGKPQQLEVKCRRCKHNQYPDTVIELSKFKELEKVRGSLAVMFEDGFVLYN